MTITKWWDYPRSPSVFVSFQCCPEDDLRSKLQEKENYRIVGHKFRFTILLLIIKDYDEDDLRSKLQEKENFGRRFKSSQVETAPFFPLFFLLLWHHPITITIILTIIMSSSPRQRENCFALSHPSLISLTIVNKHFMDGSWARRSNNHFKQRRGKS